ncbi:MAG: beta-glucosidase [Spirochaetes bacterium]|nr:beta-glucosidase [Spirochaetota bacterium]MBN2771596.1 beta-glucosidase [Spirochaetota bacterium]
MNFPKNFLFGAASSSYQIEGAWDEDGKGESIWDHFAHIPGKIKNGENGDIACDFYHRYRDDIQLMKEIGLQAFRFSINWPRVIPDGYGKVNIKGLDFYNRLVDELLAAGIKPCVNLYHWELPQTLQNLGGWMNRDCAKWFSEFSSVIADKLGDRVDDWMTLNEPMMSASLGYVLGYHAPGLKKPLQFFKVVHHLLLGHGLSVKAVRAEAPSCKIGIALDLRPVYPESESIKDLQAVKNADALMRRTFLDPIFNGTYPPLFNKQNILARARIKEGDLKIISTPIDYVGINTYSRDKVRYSRWAIGTGFTGPSEKTVDKEYVKDGIQYTAMNWEVYPQCIYEILMMLKKDYGNPDVYVTENGAAFTDTVENNRVHDIKRISYLKDHLTGVKQALDEGSNCKGYFVWSFIDNFEWSEGYCKRFGLIYVDYKTQKRIIKDSGLWYKNLITSNKC